MIPTEFFVPIDIHDILQGGNPFEIELDGEFSGTLRWWPHDEDAVIQLFENALPIQREAAAIYDSEEIDFRQAEQLVTELVNRELPKLDGIPEFVSSFDFWPEMQAEFEDLFSEQVCDDGEIFLDWLTQAAAEIKSFQAKMETMGAVEF